MKVLPFFIQAEINNTAGVELEDGIGHPGHPTRLHARCHSLARSSAARIPNSPCVRSVRGSNSRAITTE